MIKSLVMECKILLLGKLNLNQCYYSRYGNTKTGGPEVIVIVFNVQFSPLILNCTEHKCANI